MKPALRGQGMIGWEDPESIPAETYRILRTNLRLASPAEQLRTSLQQTMGLACGSCPPGTSHPTLPNFREAVVAAKEQRQQLGLAFWVRWLPAWTGLAGRGSCRQQPGAIVGTR